MKFRARDRTPRVGITLSRGSGSASLVVADNGIGVRSEHLPMIFDRFFQASASIEGSGIGLSICRETLERMGAAITLESPGEGMGAAVTMTFPAVEEDS